MIGEPLKAVQEGVRSLLKTLMRNPYALETVWLSVITFDAKARVTTPLTELASFSPPALSVKPGTAMGSALELLQTTIERDLKKGTAESKGDFKPLVFILTDGQPTDNWQRVSKNLLKSKSKIAYIYTIGCGEEVDFKTMGSISDACIHLKDLSPEAMSKIFVWLSASISSSSAQVNEGPVDLTKSPLGNDLELVDLTKPPAFVSQKWLFFHVICQTTKKYFLARFSLDQKSGMYFPNGAFNLPDDFFSEGSIPAPQVDVNKLISTVQCPFCGNKSFCHCDACDTINCFNHKSKAKTITCAKCGEVGYLITDSDFTIGGSAG
jgi:uncharacterized protein YegL